MIDIVVPYVNPNDKNWQELHSKFNKCKVLPKSRTILKMKEKGKGKL